MEPQRLLRPYLWLLTGAAVTALSALVVAVFDPLGGALEGSVDWHEVDEIIVPGGVALIFLLVSLISELRRGRRREGQLADLYGELLRKDAELERLAITDPLTGLYNRRFFQSRLGVEIERSKRYGRGLSLVMLDVDNFKLLNDHHGHQSGDKVLQELALLLVRQVRNVDLVARYGGEEFAIILLEIERSELLEVAERLCRTVAKMEVLSVLGEKLSITASLGLACFPTDAADKSTLIQLADEAMYRSKAFGKNRVTMVDRGAGRHRTTLGPTPSSAVLMTVADGAGPKTGSPAERTSPRHGRSLSADAFPAEVQLIHERRRKLAGGASSSAMLAAVQAMPKPERRRVPVRVVPEPGQDKEGQENELKNKAKDSQGNP